MSKLTLDLHPLYNQSMLIDQELMRIMREAVEKKIPLVEIIPGKGSGQLKKRVLRFLAQGNIKQLYHRYEVDERNFGKIIVHFKYTQR